MNKEWNGKCLQQKEHTRGNMTWLRKLQKGCTRLAAASDKSILVACPWSVVLSGYTTKTGRLDIAKSSVKHQTSNKIECFDQPKSSRCCR